MKLVWRTQHARASIPGFELATQAAEAALSSYKRRKRKVTK